MSAPLAGRGRLEQHLAQCHRRRASSAKWAHIRRYLDRALAVDVLLAATRAQRGQLLAASAAQETPQGLRVLPRARPVSPAAMHGTRARQGKGSAATACQGPTLLTLLQLFVLFAQQGHICNILNVYQSATVFTFQRSRRWRVAYLLDSA